MDGVSVEPQPAQHTHETLARAVNVRCIVNRKYDQLSPEYKRRRDTQLLGCLTYITSIPAHCSKPINSGITYGADCDDLIFFVNPFRISCTWVAYPLLVPYSDCV